MPEVNENNTHWMFGRVDTAFGGTVQQMAPHLFGPDANEKPAFEHLEHAVEFEQDAMRVAAQHVTPDSALAVAEQARIESALAEAQAAADAAVVDADGDGEVDASELEAAVARLVAAGAAAADARAKVEKAAAKKSSKKK